ncbi:MAG: hypothetical protein AB7Q37_08645 [Pyrinomonadaceae bacterium]
MRIIFVGLTILIGTFTAAALDVTLKDRTFFPHQAFVQEGETINICNNDTVFHRVFSMSRHNRFGGEDGIQIKPGECTSYIAQNPTAGCIPLAVFDTIHSLEKMALTVLRKGGGPAECVKGTWEIVQGGGQTRYVGTLILNGSGNSISGRAEWANHQQGTISGSVNGFKIRFSIEYGDGLVGTYTAELSDKITEMRGGTAASNKGGPGVAWQATRK